MENCIIGLSIIPVTMIIYVLVRFITSGKDMTKTEAALFIEPIDMICPCCKARIRRDENGLTVTRKDSISTDDEKRDAILNEAFGDSINYED